MLSRLKVSYLAAAAMLAISAGIVATPDIASAQGGTQFAQAGDNRRSESRREHRSDNARSDRSRNTVTTRQVVRRDIQNDRRHVVRHDIHRDRRHVVVRRDNWRYGYGHGYGYGSYAAAPLAFVVLGPRVTYASYGSGYCRALHSGRHWATRIGWHRGRHVGAVRC